MHLFCTCVLSYSLLMASPQVSASVSNSFKDCSHFFYMQTPPVGMKGTSPRRICQKYADKLRYATLYDSRRHLPLYSAYIFKKSDGKRRMDTPWMYEPQVETNVVSLSVTSHHQTALEDRTFFTQIGLLPFCQLLWAEFGKEEKGCLELLPKNQPAIPTWLTHLSITQKCPLAHFF